MPPPITNAYTCGCSCNPGPRDVASPIAADDDDAEETALRRLDPARQRRPPDDVGVPRRPALRGPRHPAGRDDPGRVRAVHGGPDRSQPGDRRDPHRGLATTRRRSSAPTSTSAPDPSSAPPGGLDLGRLDLRRRGCRPEDDRPRGAHPDRRGPAGLDRRELARPRSSTRPAGSRIAASADAAGNRAAGAARHLRRRRPRRSRRNIPVCLERGRQPGPHPGCRRIPTSTATATACPDVLAGRLREPRREHATSG